MAAFDRHMQAVLGAAVAAGRVVLRDLEPDEVPSRLRRVAQTTGGRLPPPLAASLLTEIDASESLRKRCVEAYHAAEVDEPASAAFLEREGGWWLVVAQEAVAHAGRVAESAAAELMDREQQLSRSLADAKRDRNRLQREVAAKAAPDPESAAALERVRSRLEEAQRRSDAHADSLASIEATLESTRVELAESEQRSAGLYRRLRELRVERAALLRALESGGKESVPRDPLALAAMLDSTAVTIAPFRAAPRDAAVGAADAGRFHLPHGVRPDQAHAIDALAALDPESIVIDGHNVLGVIDRTTMGAPEARKGFVTMLGRLARLAPGAQVLVVFDSALAGGRESFASADGVIVRFSEQAELADDVIVELTAETAQRVAVISNDRDVRERCARLGALPLWADALAGWLDTSG